MEDANNWQFSPNSAEDDGLQGSGFDGWTPDWLAKPSLDLDNFTDIDECPSTGAPPSSPTSADTLAETVNNLATELPGGETVAREAHDDQEERTTVNACRIDALVLKSGQPRWSEFVPTLPSDPDLFTDNQCPSTGAPPSSPTSADTLAETVNNLATELPGGEIVAREAHDDQEEWTTVDACRNDAWSDSLSDRFQNEILRLLSLLISLGPMITFLPPILRSCFLPLSELGPLKDLLVAGSALGRFCIKLAGDGLQKLVVCNTAATSQKFNVLPPLLDEQPVVMLHLRVDDSSQPDYYRVVAAGTAFDGTGNAFLKTQVYSSTTGEWECAPNFPGFCLYQCQNGVYFTDSERELLLCVGIVDVVLGTKGILIYDLKKKQWEKGPIISLAWPTESANDNDSTMQIAECGGYIFVLSHVQDFGGDMYSCVHRLNMKGTLGTSKSEEIVPWRKTTRGLELYPEYICVSIKSKFPSLLGATVLVESGYMFNFQEEGEDVFIYIHEFKPSPDGSGIDWEVVWRCKWTRPRAPNWTPWQISAFLISKEEALGVVDGAVWCYISQDLRERHGIIRDPKACEDHWGTLLKRHKRVEEYLKLKSIQGDTSAWREFWNPDRGNHRITMEKREFTLENYERMSRIRDIRSWKKAGGNKKQIVESASLGPSSSSQVTNNPVPSAGPVGDRASAVAALCNVLSGGNQNLTNEKMVNTTEEALKYIQIGFDFLNRNAAKEAQAAKEVQAEKEAPASTTKRPRKARASTTGRPRKARRMAY